MDFQEVVDELYGVAPDEFTALRNARATEARADDRSLATTISKLRKPVRSAWLANMLVRECQREMDQFFALGAALRDAQERLDASDVRHLSQQRHEIVRTLGREARKLAGDRDEPITEPTMRELQETLEAALVDPQAADALRQGRLTNPIHYSGFVPLGAESDHPFESAVFSTETVGGRPTVGDNARPATGPRKRARDGAGVGRLAHGAQVGKVAHGAEAQIDERALRNAEAEVADTHRRLEHERHELDAAEQRNQRLSREITELREELERRREEERDSAKAARDARRRYQEAERQARIATERLKRAKAKSDPPGS